MQDTHLGHVAAPKELENAEMGWGANGKDLQLIIVEPPAEDAEMNQVREVL